MVSITLTKTRDNIRRAGIPASVLAFLVGVPESSLRAAFAGRYYFGAAPEVDFLSISTRCLEITEALGPLTFRDWSALKQLLESGREPADVKAWVAQMFDVQE